MRCLDVVLVGWGFGEGRGGGLKGEEGGLKGRGGLDREEGFR